MMSVEVNEEAVRRYLQIGWGEDRPELFDELLDQDCIRHLAGAVTGGATAKGALRAFRRAFPDARVAIELLFGKDDMVACRSTTTGTHRQAYLGVQPSGRVVTISAVDIFRLSHGRIVESWHNVDEVGMLRQMRGPEA